MTQASIPGNESIPLPNRFFQGATLTRKVLIVGGTGPTGVKIVGEFLASGDEVVVFHSGQHEPGPPSAVEHIHGDARDPGGIAASLGSRQWDIAVCTSGRLRALATHLAGKTARLVGITGQPVYDGTMQATPEGSLALPIPEFAPRQRSATNYTGKVAEGEDQLFAQHGNGDFEAVVVRYPGVYGPYGHLAHEWAIVKRILAGRRRMAMPHGGTTYFQRGFASNLGRLVFLAATRPEAAGQAFNAGDERVFPARRIAQIIVDELNGQLEFEDIPAQHCVGSFPLAEKSSLILDLSKARILLGYRDLVDVERATRITARWLARNPAFASEISPAFGGSLEFQAEDALLDSWRSAIAPFERPVSAK